MTTPEERAQHIYDVTVWQYVQTKRDSGSKLIIIEHIAAEIRAAIAAQNRQQRSNPMTMPTIINYCLVGDYDPEELAGVVRRLISVGWQPFGGVATTRIAKKNDTFGRYQYTQAMVLYAREQSQ